MSYGIDQQDDNNNYFGPQVPTHGTRASATISFMATATRKLLSPTLKGSQNCGDLNTPATTTGFTDFTLLGLKPPNPTTRISTSSGSGS